MSRILIIEDSNAIAKILEMTINSAQGLEVIGISTSGLEAIEDVKNLQPDLITLDLHLPEMDGVEVLTNIRKLCLAPVIVISSTADTTLPICKQVLAEGAYAVVGKPPAVNGESFKTYSNSLVETIHKALQHG